MSYDDNRISDQIDGGLMDREQQLLDHFAGLAMQAIVNNSTRATLTFHNANDIAIISYEYAEAMMKERERRLKGV